MSYAPVPESYDEGMDNVDIEGRVDDLDDRTPLDRTIDRIGMGSYQWILLCLCGFGWLADSMWMEAIVLILPRVQQHFSVHDSQIGILSSTTSAGMAFGAVGWGACSDLLGRTIAFNATLFLTSVFGLFASLAGSFTGLCFALFLLGSAVGGSLPTDATLLLEHMPSDKSYLLTALSVFLTFGEVVASVIGLLVIPKNSCPTLPATCDIASQNKGWKYLLFILGVITLSMFLARIVLFRLHESPRYLVHAGRPQEAMDVLRMISKYNGKELSLDLADIGDTIRSPASLNYPDPLIEENAQRGNLHSSLSDTQNYNSIGVAEVRLQEHEEFGSLLPQSSHSELPIGASSIEPASVPIPEPRPIPRRQVPSLISHHHMFQNRSSTSSEYVKGSGGLFNRVLPRGMSRSVLAWSERIAMVLTPEWLRTTLLVWAVWFSISLAYRIFDVYLPKLLEERSPSDDRGGAQNSVKDSLWSFVVYTLGGCPGPILGAWLVSESPLGRRWSLVGSTFVTAFCYWTFVLVEHQWAVRASLVGISLSSAVMWAVLHGWTPELFETRVRGTACGIASALSRIAAMIGPILGGGLLTVDRSLLVYASITACLFAGLCVLLLEERKGERGGARVLAH